MCVGRNICGDLESAALRTVEKGWTARGAARRNTRRNPPDINKLATRAAALMLDDLIGSYIALWIGEGSVSRTSGRDGWIWSPK